MKTKIVYIDSSAKLKLAKKDIETSPVLCLDTEYDSMRYFREKLCLLQIATQKKIYFCDPLNGFCLSFLTDTFANPAQVKVFHAAENDIRLLKRDYAFSFNNIFDTQRVALLLGCRTPSLSNLIEKFLGIEIEKSKKVQRSRWDQRPLDEVQLIYAATDVHYLYNLYKRLGEILTEKALWEKAREVFDGVATIKWHSRKFDSHGYKKVAGFEMLSPAQQKRLRELYRWRFHKAKLLDRAVYRIMSDKELLVLVAPSETAT